MSDFVEADYDLLHADAEEDALAQLGHSLNLEREGSKPTSISLRKTYRVKGDTVNVAYELLPDRDLKGLLFGTELSLALPCGPHHDGVMRFHGAAPKPAQSKVLDRGVHPDVSTIEMIDPFYPMTIELTLPMAATVVVFPLETASQSESGFEKTYQGTTISIFWPCELDACDALETSVAITLRDHPREEQ